MSNGWKLEMLRQDGPGSAIWLDFWDSLHGQDRHWVVYPDGSVTAEDRDPDNPENTIERVNVNLGLELQDLMEFLEKRGD